MGLKEKGIYIAKIYGSIAKIQIIEITKSSIYFENLDTEEHKRIRIKKGGNFFNGGKAFPILDVLEDIPTIEDLLISKQLLEG